MLLRLRQCDDKDFRGPSWRRQFPPRDIHGISMMPGSAETLPAGFRLTATSGHSRRLPPEGKSLFLRPPPPPTRRSTMAPWISNRHPCFSFSPTAAVQSCTRRRTTVLTRRIPIGFKVSHAPPPKRSHPLVPCLPSSFSANGPLANPQVFSRGVQWLFGAPPALLTRRLGSSESDCLERR